MTKKGQASPLAEALDATSPELEEQRRINIKLQRDVAQARAKTHDYVQAVIEGARQANVILGPVKLPPVPKLTFKRQRQGSEEAALLHTTDWQVGKKTASYDTEVAKHRLTVTLTYKVGKLTEIHRTSTFVRDIHVLVGGDMIEGTNIFPGQVWEVDSSRFGQLKSGAWILTTMLLYLLSIYEHVHVWEECGNHGRLGRKGEDGPQENLDLVMYLIARERLAQAEEEGRLIWHEQPGTHYVPFEIGNYKGLLFHGDEIQGANGRLPMAAILTRVTNWLAGGIENPDGPGLYPFMDAYHGHYHTPHALVLPSGRTVYGTGSPESGNMFASVYMASTGQPSQRLHFIHPEKAFVTGEHRLVLIDN